MLYMLLNILNRKTILFAASLGMIIILLIVLALPADAREDEPTTGIDPEPEEEVSQSFLDKYHNYFTDKIRGPTIWFDNFFGDPRTDQEELPTSFVRLRLATRYIEGDGLNFPIRLRANVKLPRFSRRFRLIVIGENQDDLQETQRDEAETPVPASADNKESTSLGLRYTIYSTLRSKFHFGGGLSLNTPVESYVRMYYRRRLHIGKNNIIEFTETGFWNSIRGFGHTTRVDFNRVLSDKLTGRLSLFGTYAEESNGVEWGAEVNLFSQLTPKSAVSYDLGAYGETRPSSRTTNYRIATRYRKNFFRPWLFFEVEPEVTFPLDAYNERKAVGALALVLEIQFTT